MRYGIDFGIKVDVPWYIKCPLINRMFDTCLVEIALTTFTTEGAPMIGVNGQFRIPIQKRCLDISSVTELFYSFPASELLDGLPDCGYGLFCKTTLLDVNHKDVLSSTERTPLSASFYAVPEDKRVWFGSWQSLCIDLKFGNRDFYEI